jgi:hypothetical protein
MLMMLDKPLKEVEGSTKELGNAARRDYLSKKTIILT